MISHNSLFFPSERLGKNNVEGDLLGNLEGHVYSCYEVASVVVTSGS